MILLLIKRNITFLKSCHSFLCGLQWCSHPLGRAHYSSSCSATVSSYFISYLSAWAEPMGSFEQLLQLGWITANVHFLFSLTWCTNTQVDTCNLPFLEMPHRFCSKVVDVGRRMIPVWAPLLHRESLENLLSLNITELSRCALSNCSLSGENINKANTLMVFNKERP